jgi:ribonuclease VapC
MIVDSSAVVGILNGEPDAEALSDALVSARNRRISAATLVELYVVVDGKRDPVRSARLEEFLQRSEVEIIDVTAEQAHIARTAYRDFGRGSGHPAHLNFGDCFSYALARATGESLLFKGDDFGHTDLTPAVTAGPA